MAVTAMCAIVATVMTLGGPGTDLDVANVFRSGRSIARHLDYVPSRPPGAPVHEAIVGVSDLIGGPLLATFLSTLAATVLVWSLNRLLLEEGYGPNRRWALAILIANPWFIVAATSAADYVWALMFVAIGVLALRQDKSVLAGVMFALSMGSRVGSATLIAAALVAEISTERGDHSALGDQSEQGDQGGTDLRRDSNAKQNRTRVAKTAVVCALGTAIAFVPSVLAAGGLAFAQNDFSTSSPLVQVGRALAKDLLLLGLPATVLILVTALPSLLEALRRWKTSWLVRFSVTGLIASQLLFLRFPWKMAHLLPTLLCAVILLAVALESKPRLLIAIAIFQVVFAFVRVDILSPNNPSEATGARLKPLVATGPVLQDWQCRRVHDGVERGRQIEEVEPAWQCSVPYSD